MGILVCCIWWDLLVKRYGGGCGGGVEMGGFDLTPIIPRISSVMRPLGRFNRVVWRLGGYTTYRTGKTPLYSCGLGGCFVGYDWWVEAFIPLCSLGRGVGVRVQRCASSEHSFSLWGVLGCGFVALFRITGYSVFKTLNKPWR